MLVSVRSLGVSLGKNLIPKASLRRMGSMKISLPGARSYASVAKENEDPVVVCARLRERVRGLEREILHVSIFFILPLVYIF